MLRHSPFHDRVAAANQTSLWSHWAGCLVVDRYQMSEKWEYTAVRNAVGIFDTSPLYKYRIRGRDAERFLARVLTRDVRACAPGQAQYTVWCDDRGFVNEDGVVFRHGPEEFVLTAAEPNLAYLQDLAGSRAGRYGGEKLDIIDETEDFGILAVQGPRSAAVVGEIAPEALRLGYFEHTAATIGGAAVTISRTGYTGDLGFEIVVPAGEALAVWDAVDEAGAPHGLVPFGQTALLMTRIEAGLLLIDVDFGASRHAPNDEHRSSPWELGLGWMLRDIDDESRRFVGRDAIRRERDDRTSRWTLTGLVVDWDDHMRRHAEAGLLPDKDHTPVQEEMMVYDREGQPVGYATSFMYSPVLQRHIALARVRPADAAPGTPLALEFTINHRYVQIGAQTTRIPFYRPARKTASLVGGNP